MSKKHMTEIKNIEQLFTPGSISSEQLFQSIRPLNHIKICIHSLKPDENKLLLKKIIQLFYQSCPILDFNPAEQFKKIQTIPLTQQNFCSLITDVIFKKTKNKVDWAKSFLSLKHKQQKNQHIEDNDLQNESLKINKYKFLCDILKSVKTSCTQFEQLIYKMIDLHHWRCQVKNKCQQVYMQGYLAKLLFKKVFIPSGIFDEELEQLRALFCLENLEKQSNSTQEKQSDFTDQKQLHYHQGPISEICIEELRFFECKSRAILKEPDIVSLQKQLTAWGLELCSELFTHKTVSNLIDQKSSPENKYFVCYQCYFRSNNHQKQKHKHKHKKKKLFKNFNLTLNQDSHLVKLNQKQNLTDVQSKAITKGIDDQLTSTQKDFENLLKYLDNFQIDIENREQVRLDLESDEDNENLNEDGRNLIKKMHKILYPKRNQSSMSTHLF